MDFKVFNRFNILLLFAFLCVVGCIADKPDTPTVVVEEQNIPELLNFYWEFQSGKRNGRNAPSLDGLFFDFTEKDSLSTNIMGTLETDRYKLAGNIIRRHGQSPMNFEIDSITNGYLKLLMTMNNTNFEFELVKKVKKATN